jgi:hypothetical protein
MLGPLVNASKVQNQFYRCLYPWNGLDCLSASKLRFEWSRFSDPPRTDNERFKWEVAVQWRIDVRPQTKGQGATHKLRWYQITINYGIGGSDYCNIFLRVHCGWWTWEFAKPNFPIFIWIELDRSFQFDCKCWEFIVRIKSLQGITEQLHVNLTLIAVHIGPSDILHGTRRYPAVEGFQVTFPLDLNLSSANSCAVLYLVDYLRRVWYRYEFEGVSRTLFHSEKRRMLMNWMVPFVLPPHECLRKRTVTWWGKCGWSSFVFQF